MSSSSALGEGLPGCQGRFHLSEQSWISEVTRQGDRRMGLSRRRRLAHVDLERPEDQALRSSGRGRPCRKQISEKTGQYKNHGVTQLVDHFGSQPSKRIRINLFLYGTHVKARLMMWPVAKAQMGQLRFFVQSSPKGAGQNFAFRYGASQVAARAMSFSSRPTARRRDSALPALGAGRTNPPLTPSYGCAGR